MNTTFQKLSSFQKLSFLCDDHSDLRAKFVKISYSIPTKSQVSGIIALFIEYFQIISPVLLFSLAFQNSREEHLPTVLEYLAKSLHPAYWVETDTAKHSGVIIISVLFALFLFRVFLCLYMIYQAYLNKVSEGILPWLWRFLFKFHGRGIYSLFTTFWVNCIISIRNRLENPKDYHHDKWLIPVGIIIILIEFCYYFMSHLRYTSMLPTKNFLSAKNNTIENFNLVQKFMIQIIFMTIISESSQSKLWVFTILNVILDICRVIYFFTTLPLYKFTALKYQASLMMLSSSLNFSCFILCIVKSVKENISSTRLLIITWTIVSILTIYLSIQGISILNHKIIFDPSIKSPSFLIHRVNAIKELKKKTKGYWKSGEKYDKHLLSNETLNANLKEILKLGPDFEIENAIGPLDINDKPTANQLFLHYLAKLALQHPKNRSIQLYSAYFNVKTLGLYNEAVRVGLSLKDDNFSNVHLSVALLLLFIQYKLEKKYSGPLLEDQLDLTDFATSQGLLANLKLQMIKQAQLQIEICEETIKDTPNLAHISIASQKFANCQKKTKKLCNYLMKTTPDHFLEPPVLCSGYYLTLNHSLHEFDKYYEVFIQRRNKSERYFQEDKLTKQNQCQDNTGFAIISGQKADAGTIVFMNKAMEPIFGCPAQSATGTHAATRAVPCFRAEHLNFYKSLTEKGAEENLGTVTDGFAYHQDGYAIPLSYYVNIHPFITQGFYFFIIMRPVRAEKDYIFLLENGDIDCSTKNVGEKLGILPTYKDSSSKPSFNVRNISDQLSIINEAFNIIAFPDRNSKSETTIEKAQAIYSAYSQGQDITFTPITNKNLTYSYHCKIINQPVGSQHLVKILVLQENKQEYKIKTNPNELTLKSNTNFDTKEITTDLREDSAEIEDEKQQGWIDFEPLTSNPNLSPQKYSLLSPRSPRDLLLSTEANRQLLTSSRTQQDDNNAVTSLQQLENKNIFDFSDTTNDPPPLPKTKNVLRLLKPTASLKSSSLSKLAQQKRISKLFHAALDRKTFPKLYLLLRLLTVALFLALIISEIALRKSVDNNTDNLKVKKDILREVQLRSYKILIIQTNIRVIWDGFKGKVNAGAYGGLAFLFPSYKYSTQKSLVELAQSNQYLLGNTSKLDYDMKEFLFRGDVKIYENYFDQSPDVYEMMDSFQATNRIIETGLYVVNTSRPITNDSAGRINFLLRNGLNELVLKNEAISDLFSDSLDAQREDIESSINSYLIALITVTVVISALFAFILWKQYVKKQVNLTAFCRLNHSRISFVLKNIKGFKEIIETDNTLQVKFICERAINKPFEANSHRDTVKNEFKKVPNTKGITKKYFSLFMKLMFFMVCVIGIIVGSATVSRTSIHSLQNKQTQIFFADQVEVNIRLGLAASYELLSTNNTSKMRNMAPLEELEKLTSDFTDLRLLAYKLFLQNDDEDASSTTIKSILIGDLCVVLENAFFAFSCNVLKKNGIKTGLIYLLSNLEDLLADKQNQYLASDKSAASLKAIEARNLDVITANYILASAGSQFLSDIVDERFENELKDARQLRTLNIYLVVICLVILSCFMWFVILKNIKNSINHFNNILRVLPGDLVLSSFLLKTFLMKNCPSLLDPIRNDI